MTALTETQGNPATDTQAGDAGQVDTAALRDMILGSLEDDKGEAIVTIDLAGKTSLADYLVIASGRSTRQVAAMAEHLSEKLKRGGSGYLSVEGLPQADWVVVDAGDVIVHLFRPEVRSFYNIEKMWGVEPPPAPAEPDYFVDTSGADEDDDEA